MKRSFAAILVLAHALLFTSVAQGEGQISLYGEGISTSHLRLGSSSGIRLSIMFPFVRKVKLGAGFARFSKSLEYSGTVVRGFIHPLLHPIEPIQSDTYLNIAEILFNYPVLANQNLNIAIETGMGTHWMGEHRTGLETGQVAGISHWKYGLNVGLVVNASLFNLLPLDFALTYRYRKIGFIGTMSLDGDGTFGLPYRAYELGIGLSHSF